jgi:iron complex transport system substrate-binding protein
MNFFKIFYSFIICVVALSCDNTTNPTKLSGIIQKPQYAQGFFVESYQDYQILHISKPYTDKTDTLRYILCKDKKRIPSRYRNLPHIVTPIQKIITTSTTHLALLEALDGLELLTASSSLDYAYSPKIQKMLQSGKVVKLSDQNIDIEKIIALKPDVLMVSGMESSQMAAYQKIQQAGIPILVNSEWLEQHPLGKAEWIQVMGLLLGKHAKSKDFFEDITQKYNHLKQLVQKVSPKKMVAIGVPNKDTWYVPAGESFGSVFLKDAGVAYAFSDTKGIGSLQLSKEIVFEKFIQADVWLNAEVPTHTQQSIFCDFRQFKAVKNKQVYDRQKRLSKNGGNDYWESGVLHPEKVLSDLIQILYPELLPNDSLYYHRRIPINCP